MSVLRVVRPARAAAGQLLQIVRLVLCEIFDEAAYARYLQRAGAPVSRESYARFMAEKHATKGPAARCC